MKLPPIVLASNNLNPSPISVAKHDAGEARGGNALDFNQFSTPAENSTVRHDIPRHDIMMQHKITNISVRSQHEIPDGLGLRHSEPEHLADH